MIGGFVDAHGDVLALLPERVYDRAGLWVETDFGAVITDLFDNRTGKLVEVDNGFAANFTGEHHDTGFDHGLAGDSRFAVLGKHGVDDRIRYLISDFVWVAFRNGFGSK